MKTRDVIFHRVVAECFTEKSDEMTIENDGDKTKTMTLVMTTGSSAGTVIRPWHASTRKTLRVDSVTDSYFKGNTKPNYLFKVTPLVPGCWVATEAFCLNCGQKEGTLYQHRVWRDCSQTPWLFLVDCLAVHGVENGLVTDGCISRSPIDPPSLPTSHRRHCFTCSVSALF